VRWDNPADRVVFGPKLLMEMQEKMVRIKYNLKLVQDKKKSYVDKGKNHRDFKVGHYAFFKVKAKRSSQNLGNCSKMATSYCGLFEILERVGPY
jgi:hypothetical protein